MTRLEEKSINQIMLQIISPVLIICVVASLVFFFIEVLYRGPHTSRLYWVMGLFTAAAVLVCRISIEEGRERAQLFGLALAAATMIACTRLVEFSYAGLPIVGPLIIAALILLVMWTTSKLTWDCTVVDRSRDGSSTGLIENIRRRIAGRSDADSTTETPGGPGHWIANLFAGTRKQNTPGVWVFYFAMFAFPVFGLGQWFVQPESRRWIFVLFAVYLAATLGLLMITSLLGLERYLSRRNLHVPLSIVANWLLVGSLFALAVMLAVMLIPAPASSLSMSNLLAMFTSPLRESSPIAPGHDGQRNEPEAKKMRLDRDGGDPVLKPGGKPDQDAPQAGSAEPKSGKNDPNGGQNGGQNSKPDANPSKSESKSNEPTPKGDDGKPKSEQGEDDHSPSDDSPQNGAREKAANEDENADENKARAAADPDANAADPDASKDEPAENREQHEVQGQPANRQQQQQVRPEQQQKQPEKRPPEQQQPEQRELQSDSSSSDRFNRTVRTIMRLIGLLAAAFFVWLFRREIAAFLNSLLRKSPKQSKAAEPAPHPSVQLPTFRSFQDPFLGGKAGSMSARQIVSYSMLALEAWSREFAVPRVPDSTPHEFARRLMAVDADLGQAAAELAELYGRCAFSGENVSRIDSKPLVNLWRRMSAIAVSGGLRKTAVPVS